MGDGVTDPSPQKETMGAIFERLCPIFLSYGMPYDLYWNGDVCAAKAYLKAEEYKRQRKNEELWLQGMYIYSALCDVSPVLHAFAKSGTRPSPYMEHPIPLTVEQNKKETPKKEDIGDAKAKAYMEMFMIKHNKKMERRLEEHAGDH